MHEIIFLKTIFLVENSLDREIIHAHVRIKTHKEKIILKVLIKWQNFQRAFKALHVRHRNSCTNSHRKIFNAFCFIHASLDHNTTFLLMKYKS